MPRLSTRVKRRKSLGTSHRKHRFWKGRVEGRRRLKSFPTKEQALAWAKERGLDEGVYELRQHPSGKWQWHPRKRAGMTGGS